MADRRNRSERRLNRTPSSEASPDRRRYPGRRFAEPTPLDDQGENQPAPVDSLPLPRWKTPEGLSHLCRMENGLNSLTDIAVASSTGSVTIQADHLMAVRNEMALGLVDVAPWEKTAYLMTSDGVADLAAAA